MPGMPDPAPLLVVDTPSLLYRAFFALPSSIKGLDGRPVNGLLGCANLVLQVVETYAPRAVVCCNGAEAAHYRTAAYAGYHGDRDEMPEKLVWQWEAAPAFFARFGWTHHASADLEADDLLGAYAKAEREAGGRTLLFTGDRDMFQCVDGHTTVLFPGGKDGPAYVDADGVRERYGIEPAQVPDFIALRGDPSDGLPGAKGIGAKGAAALLAEHGDLDTLIDLAERDAAPGSKSLKPRVRTALREQADELRTFRHIATLQPVPVRRPDDQPTRFAEAAEAARELGMARLADRLAAAAA